MSRLPHRRPPPMLERRGRGRPRLVLPDGPDPGGHLRQTVLRVRARPDVRVRRGWRRRVGRRPRIGGARRPFPVLRDARAAQPLLPRRRVPRPRPRRSPPLAVRAARGDHLAAHPAADGSALRNTRQYAPERVAEISEDGPTLATVPMDCRRPSTRGLAAVAHARRRSAPPPPVRVLRGHAMVAPS